MTDPPLVDKRNNALYKMSEKNRVAILELMKKPGNNTCADCGASSKSFETVLLLQVNRETVLIL